MKKIINTFKYAILTLLVSLAACSNETILQADYEAPNELPLNLVPGSPLNDRILELYDNFGIVVYTDVNNPRMYKDLVSEEGLIIGDRMAADTAAALVYIDMIEKEFVNTLPESMEDLIPRNFYLFKNELITGTSAYNKYEYLSKLWYNSNGDLTVGGLNNASLDSVKLKQTFYYGLSNILRNDPINMSAYYQPFVDLKTDAGVYYWQVYTLEGAYERGYLSDNQNLIKSHQQDFDLFAAWAATTPSDIREDLLSQYPLMRQKYNLVTAMFRQAGINLETVSEQWAESDFNPINN
ncbi:hypothetical protein MWU59_11600 [Flavobacteriaceae bacterium F08102]|nr:hypothetical protein [Flavobacteriaceae bacterium F08102]